MPALAAASLAVSAVQTAVNLLGHLVDGSVGDPKTGKPGTTPGKSKDGTSLADAFAACLAAVAAAAGGAAGMPVVVGKETAGTQTTGTKPSPVSMPGLTPAGLTKLPQGPSLIEAAKTAATVRTAAVQAAATAARTAAAQGKGVIASVPAGPTPTTGHATPAALPASLIEHLQPGVTDTASPLSQVHAPELAGVTETTAVLSVETAAVAHSYGTAVATHTDTLMSVANVVPQEPAPHVASAPTPPARTDALATVAAVAAPPPHTTPADTRHQSDTTTHASTDPAPPSGSPISATPTATGVPGGNNPAAPTVAEQLTRAFVAEAGVAGHDGRTDFHLRLDPPQLGTVQIHLTATDHAISARVVVASEGTRQLLEGQAHHLRESLANAGFALTGFDVSRGGGGPSGGGGQPPPEPPLPFSAPPAPPRPAVVKITTPAPRDGINVLA